MNAEIVRLFDDSVRPPSAREIAIEECAEKIVRAIGALSLHQRIGLDRALDELVDEVAWRAKQFRRGA